MGDRVVEDVVWVKKAGKMEMMIRGGISRPLNTECCAVDNSESL